MLVKLKADEYLRLHESSLLFLKKGLACISVTGHLLLPSRDMTEL